MKTSVDNQEILKRLKKVIPTPMCELVFKNNYELLIAVILSAQCTDKRVNMVTKQLFKKYPTPNSLANAKLTDVEYIIKPCGFFNVKSKNIIGACKQLVSEYGGQVPCDFNSLISLSGVGRKTANVVMALGFNIPAIAVDTHVFRVSNRLGIVSAKNELDCEKQLMNAFEKNEWINLHSSLVLFGRYYCKAQGCRCDECVMNDICKNVKRSK